MSKYQVVVSGEMTFEVEAETLEEANDKATYYVDNNRDEFEWYFDEIEVLDDD